MPFYIPCLPPSISLPSSKSGRSFLRTLVLQERNKLSSCSPCAAGQSVTSCAFHILCQRGNSFCCQKPRVLHWCPGEGACLSGFLSYLCLQTHLCTSLMVCQALLSGWCFHVYLSSGIPSSFPLSNQGNVGGAGSPIPLNPQFTLRSIHFLSGAQVDRNFTGDLL